MNPTTVDAIIERDGKILLIKRKNNPFKGIYAFPGGFVDFGETVEQAVRREVLEECQIQAEPIGILGVYSGTDRDPRGPVISVVFVCQSGGNPRAADDAQAVAWVDRKDIEEKDLAFDHHQILQNYLHWKKNREQTFWTDKNE